MAIISIKIANGNLYPLFDESALQKKKNRLVPARKGHKIDLMIADGPGNIGATAKNANAIEYQNLQPPATLPPAMTKSSGTVIRIPPTIGLQEAY
jgi:hypothetical protein